MTPATPKKEKILNFYILRIRVRGNYIKPTIKTMKKSDKKKLSRTD